MAIWTDEEQVLGIVDINKNFGGRENIRREIRIKQANGDTYIKINLYSIEEMQGLEYTHFIVCADNEDEIKEKLIGKVDSNVKWIVPYWTENAGKLEAMSIMRNVWLNHENVVDTMSVFHARQAFIQPMSSDIDEFTLMNGRQKNMHPLGMHNGNDYVRIRTLELLIREIKAKKIEGSMAEVGVFQGDFAKIMRCLLPKKSYIYSILLRDLMKGILRLK